MSIDVMMKAMVADAVRPLQMEIQELREQLAELSKHRERDLEGLCEVRGVKAAMKGIGVGDHHVIAHLVRTGALGSALWKVKTEKNQGSVYCTPAIARRRWNKYRTFPLNVREAWDMLGADNCEKKWKEMQL